MIPLISFQENSRNMKDIPFVQLQHRMSVTDTYLHLTLTATVYYSVRVISIVSLHLNLMPSAQFFRSNFHVGSIVFKPEFVYIDSLPCLLSASWLPTYNERLPLFHTQGHRLGELDNLAGVVDSLLFPHLFMFEARLHLKSGLLQASRI